MYPNKEKKIHNKPTTTHPVKNFRLKMYPVPYIGIGHRTRRVIVKNIARDLAIKLALSRWLDSARSSSLVNI